MATHTPNLERFVSGEYPQGFVTEVETDKFEPGLSEAVVRQISARKNEPDFMLQWRLQAYRHWLTLETPTWSKVHYPPIDYDAIIYYAAPKSADGPQTLDDVDPEILQTYEKLGIPLHERARLAGVAVQCLRCFTSRPQHNVASEAKKRQKKAQKRSLL